AVLLDDARLRDLGGRQGDQLVGTLKVVVLERRLVDLAREHGLVRSIGLRGIEVLGPLGEDRIQDVLPPLRRRVGVVPDLAAAGEENEHQQQRAHAESIMPAWHFSPARRSSSPACSATGRSPTASRNRRGAKAPNSRSPTWASVSRTGSPAWRRSSARAPFFPATWRATPRSTSWPRRCARTGAGSTDWCTRSALRRARRSRESSSTDC